ncbi:proton-conducting transporter membrane subunit [Jhaorihella thermophila]
MRGLILGIGLLIIIYARFYLSREDPMGQFYSYLLLFQGAMVGIVLSDNVLLLLIFWELTSLSSFLLIGYWRHLPEGRQGARMALAVTGAGGLAMIAGMLLLGHVAGSYDLTAILDQREAIQASPLYLPALVLILLGCFTKSAQFPFHFWLPHAMAAPTPVSAYLHSATMVKAGLFLMARMWPVLSGTEAWFYLVGTTGLLTMLIGAVIALFKDDLKALLAFSTVSHLGLITMLLGFGTKAAAIGAVFHIINHATFKAALFMTAGIVDHAAHTRDIKRLGGLRKLMPTTFTLATVAALSMAGIPPLNGFSQQGDDAGGSRAYRLGRLWLAGAHAGDARGAVFGCLFVSLCGPCVPGAGARRLSHRAARPRRGHVDAAGTVDAAGGADRPVPDGDGLDPGRDRRRRGDRRAGAAGPSQALARDDAGTGDVDHRHCRRRRPAGRAWLAGPRLERDAKARGQGDLRRAGGRGHAGKPRRDRYAA